MNSVDINKLLENIQTIADNLNISIHIEPKAQSKSEISMEATIKSIEKEYNDMYTEYEQKYTELDNKIVTLNDEINSLATKRASLDDNYLQIKSAFQNKLRNLFLKKTTMSLDAIDKYLSKKIDWFDARL
jgi:predicted RNase H-like nuclease (RuvC/YqgF family)